MLLEMLLRLGRDVEVEVNANVGASTAHTHRSGLYVGQRFTAPATSEFPSTPHPTRALHGVAGSFNSDRDGEATSD